MYKQSVSKRWAFKVAFEILTDKKDVAILQDIRDFFGVGKIYVVNNTATYRVVSLKELKVLIDHFNQYPLISLQLVTFNEWSKVVSMLEAKTHLKSDLMISSRELSTVPRI